MVAEETGSLNWLPTLPVNSKDLILTKLEFKKSMEEAYDAAGLGKAYKFVMLIFLWCV